MANPRRGDTIRLSYTGRLDNGRVFATTRDRAPVEVTVGDGEVSPTIEEVLLHMEPGEARTVTIPAERAYGPHRPELVMTLSRSQLPEDVPARVGQQLQVRQDDGPSRIMTITAVNEEHIIIDANHPLAGENLTFDLELVEIQATGRA